MSIILHPRRDKPPQDGLYLAMPCGTRTPLVAAWSERDGWRYQGRRVEVDRWHTERIENDWRQQI